MLDATSPAVILEVFTVCASYLLCIASVPGATEVDYTEQESNNNLVEMLDGAQEEAAEEEENEENRNLGKISLVKSQLIEESGKQPNEAGES